MGAPPSARSLRAGIGQLHYIGSPKGFEQADFLADKRTQQAVILNLLTIGEAASHIIREYPDFPERFPTLPWKQIRGMRNRMAHGYFDINLDVVWATIQQSLPELEREIVILQQVLRNETDS